jgi:hypothetical protein
MIRRFTLDSTSTLLQLASAVSQHGCATVKPQLGQPAAFAHDGEHVVGDALVLDDFMPQVADDKNGHMDETNDDESEVVGPVEEQDRAEMPQVDNPSEQIILSASRFRTCTLAPALSLALATGSKESQPNFEQIRKRKHFFLGHLTRFLLIRT